MPTREKLGVSAIYMPAKRLGLSLDLEYDYGGTGTVALSRFEDLVEWFGRDHLDCTVFVEARVLRQNPGIADLLTAKHIHPALHCFDHRKQADDKTDIERGRDLFAERLGRHPEGYRANTFRHSDELMSNLIELGFSWDSSFLPSLLGFGAGRNPRVKKLLKAGAHAVRYEDTTSGVTLNEFPVGVLRGIELPFIHSYQLLAGNYLANLAHRIFGLPILFVHDAHLVDLYRSTTSLQDGALPWLASMLYQISWRQERKNSLELMREFIDRCRAGGWEIGSIQSIQSEVSTINE